MPFKAFYMIGHLLGLYRFHPLRPIIAPGLDEKKVEMFIQLV